MDKKRAAREVNSAPNQAKAKNKDNENVAWRDSPRERRRPRQSPVELLTVSREGATGRKANRVLEQVEHKNRPRPQQPRRTSTKHAPETKTSPAVSLAKDRQTGGGWPREAAPLGRIDPRDGFSRLSPLTQRRSLSGAVESHSPLILILRNYSNQQHGKHHHILSLNN